jgi:hypothetical protein
MTTATMKLKMIAALITALEDEGDDDANEDALEMIKGVLEAGKKKS